MKKLFLFIVFAWAYGFSSYAYYEKNYPITVTQPDGMEVHCFATGDEFYHWVHDEDGFTLIRDLQTGIVVYAKLENDELVSTGYRAGSVDPATIGLTPWLNISVEKRQQLRADFFKNAPEKPVVETYGRASPQPDQPPRGGWNNGTINNLVIYIRFSDENEFPPEKAAKYDGFFNKDEPGQTSMYAYYKAASLDRTFIPSTFYPINTENAITSYQDIYPRGYYQPYNATSNPIGYTDDLESWFRGHQAFRRAIEFVADEVPEDLDLDFNNDGLVDNICFIVSGAAGAWSSLLWPHRFFLMAAEEIYINGVRAWDYNLLIEKHLDGAGTSVLAHEMSHTLGSPDLYRYEYNGTPVGIWDLMSDDQNPPQSMTAYMKWKYGGWIDDIPTITESGSYTLHNVWTESNNAYKIASPNSSTEFFVIEYRDNSVYWDSKLPGSGLIIYRINTKCDGNADGPPDEIYIYRQGGKSNMANDGNLSGAYFSLESGRTAFNNVSNPSCFLSDGSPGGIAINITEPRGETMTFNVDFSMVNTEIQVTPEKLTFANIPLGTTSEPQTFTVIGTNLKYDLLYAKTGDNSNLFAIEEIDWNPATGGTLSIRYTPTSTQINTARLVFKSIGATSQEVSLIAQGATVAINEQDVADGITIYPNPTTGLLTICDMRNSPPLEGARGGTICDVVIFDVLGRTVGAALAVAPDGTHQSQIEMDISYLPTGIYFVKIQTETDVVVRKVIKQ
ncbi:MAG: M6 family metalloprotease domain-containing protein [Bacteroidales bacterium]|nr:M6 family metalloprotease domain-containing protein [Bacteroidales bacterium]